MNEQFDLSQYKPEIRTLFQLKEVLYDQEWLKNAENFDVYYMYRNLKIENGIKYNITVLLPRMLGKEFPKTKGHVHIGNYQEIYLVLEGEAIYLMQKFNGDIVEDVYAVKASKNQAVIIPPGYGHITINPGSSILKTADWSSVNCKSDYSWFKEKGGACYFYTTEGWIKNPNYKTIPALRFEKPLDSMPPNLDFLKRV